MRQRMAKISFTEALRRLVASGELGLKEDCCVLTARLIARTADMEDRYSPANRRWWAKANVWRDEDGTIPDLFSSCWAAAEVSARVQGRGVEVSILGFEDGSTWKRVQHCLKQGKWYFVQGWRNENSGHTWLMKVSDNSLQGAEILIESDRHKGLRVNEEPWVEGSNPGRAVFLPDRFREYSAGVGLTELW